MQEQELEQRLQELEQREQALAEKENKLKKAEEKIAKAKYNLYDRIDVSVHTMNVIIVILSIALILAIIVGVAL